MSSFKMCIYSFVLFFVFGISITQFLPYLKSCDYNEIEISLILSVSAIVSVLLQIITGYLCDFFKTIKKIFIVIYILFISFICFVFISNHHIFYLCLLLSSFMNAFGKVTTSLFETWIIYLNNEKYGLYRSFGALGMCISSYVTSYIVSLYEYRSIVYVGLFLSLIIIVFSFYCDEITIKEKIDYKKFKMIFHHKEYLYMMFIVFMIYIVGSSDQYIVLNKMMDLKASSVQIGLKWALQALMEIPFFLYAYKILKRYSPYSLLKLSILGYILKFFLYSVSPTPVFIIFAGCLQIVTLPLVAYCSKIIFMELLPSLKASSQMLSMAFFIGGSAFVSPLLCNLLTNLFGINISLFVLCILLFIPYFLLIKKYDILNLGDLNER